MQVARSLLGKVLLRRLPAGLAAGVISEVEAYQGEDDLGCHARAGKTPRTTVMYGPPGRAYVYFTYGMHWLLNAVTGEENSPAAVLIRSVIPVAGMDLLCQFRPHPTRWSAEHPELGWTDGPAKLCKAFAIDGALNGVDLCDTSNGLWIADGREVGNALVVTGPRVGLFTVPEPWKSIPWRWRILPQVTLSQLIG